MVTVAIPTCARPIYLHDALESVRRQTGRCLIKEVIVSENGSCAKSADVCKCFSDLPIAYIRHDPPKAPLDHFCALVDAAQQPLVAILFDDDWWAPQHLEVSVSLLRTNKTMSGTFSNFYYSLGPGRPFWLPVANPFRVWAVSGKEFAADAIALDEAAVSLICFLDATFHYATVVGARGPIQSAFRDIAAIGNPYDNDRLFPIFLSVHGSIGFVPGPNVFVRDHPDQANKQFSNTWMSYYGATSRMILESKEECLRQGADRLKKLLSERDPIYRTILANSTFDAQRTALLKLSGLDLCPSRARGPKRLAQAVCPPFLLTMKRRLVRALFG